MDRQKGRGATTSVVVWPNRQILTAYLRAHADQQMEAWGELLAS